MPDNIQPKVEIPLTKTAKLLEVAGALLLLGIWCYTFLHLWDLPEIIPTHFRGNGEVDGYGSKWTFVLLPIIATLIYIGLSWAARFPHKVNYRVTITPENAFKQYSIVVRMYRILKIAIVLVFFLIAFQTVEVAAGNAQYFNGWFMLLIMALVLVPVFYFLIVASKNS